jgi:DNA-binding transcriptional LysR family regulator
MELRHLRYFIAVAEEGHITRAAERLGMQQPPLSQQIKALERELKVQLFRRKPRGVELTDAGRALLDNARVVFAQIKRGSEQAQRAARGEQGELSLGISSTAHFCPLVPRVVRAFREKFPQVLVRLGEGGTGELIAEAQKGLVDVAFVRDIAAPIEGLAISHLFDEEMVAALPSRHELVRSRPARSAIPLKALAAETFVFYRRPQGPGLTDVILSACQAAGFIPRFGQEALRPTSALNFVAAGHGISIVPASLQRMHLDGVAYRPLRGAAQLKAPLHLVARRGDPSPVVRQFLNMVRQAAKVFDVTERAGEGRSTPQS